jgi:hypothetical protein
MALVAILLMQLVPVIAQSQTSQQTSGDQTSTFTPSGKLWGYVFGDYMIKAHSDTLSRGKTQYAGKSYPENFNAFAFRRIYLGYDYNISEKFSAEFLLTHEGDVTDGSGDRIMYVKAANIRWKNIVKNNDLVVGQMATPFFSLMSEKVWGYRSIEKTVADMRGFAISNDLGIAWQGKAGDKGNFGYNLLVSNGTGQKLETSKFKEVWGELYVKLLEQKLILDVTGNYLMSASYPIAKSNTTIKGFIAYQTDPLTVGVEVVTQIQKNAVTDSTSGSAVYTHGNVDPFAFSVFLHGSILKNKLNYFARFDTYNPDTQYSNSDLYSKKNAYPANKYSEDFITAGFDYTPIKNVHFEPNVWIDTYQNKLSGVSGLNKSDYDFVPRLTFYYIFGK